jgi:dTMP kinase
VKNPSPIWDWSITIEPKPPVFRRVTLTPNNTGRSGLFITFEGIDGSGKSVQADRLSEGLKEREYTVTLVREPGGSSISEKIRSILLDRDHDSMIPMTELLLYEAARSQLVSEIIKPTLERGEVVICDRFIDSTSAYQGYGRDMPLRVIDSLNSLACQDIIPVSTFILDITWKESLRRRAASAQTDDRMESNIQTFFHRVREGYLSLAKAEPQRIQLIDGQRPVEEIEKEILSNVLHIFKSIKT